MVGSVNNGFQQSIPASRTFEPAQAPQNPNSNAPQQGPQGIETQRAAAPPAGTPELNQTAATSADTSRINPNATQNFGAGQERGSVLDISI